MGFQVLENTHFKDSTQPIREVTREDILLCERLLTSYHKAVRNKSKVEQATASSSWSAWINKYYSEFISVLEERDAEKLAATLASSFRESFVAGLTSGYLFDHSLSRIGAKLWSLCYQDNVIALAEYLGLVRAESREQGEIAYGLKNGLDPIVAKTEDAIGISMDFPDVGAPYGVMANNSLITREHPEHIYVALRINHAVQNYLNDRVGKNLNIMEIGGGVGDLAYWTVRLGRTPLSKYNIIDLPCINVLQGYFFI